MLADERWKFTHLEGGFRPILFHKQSDPQETVDRALKPDAEAQAALDKFYGHLAHFRARVNQRTTLPRERIKTITGKSRRRGIVLGLYDEAEGPELLSA